MDLVNWSRVELEKTLLPIRIELVRVAIPAAILVFFIGLACGYGWAMRAFGG